MGVLHPAQLFHRQSRRTLSAPVPTDCLVHCPVAAVTEPTVMGAESCSTRTRGTEEPNVCSASCGTSLPSVNACTTTGTPAALRCGTQQRCAPEWRTPPGSPGPARATCHPMLSALDGRPARCFREAPVCNGVVMVQMSSSDNPSRADVHGRPLSSRSGLGGRRPPHAEERNLPRGAWRPYSVVVGRPRQQHGVVRGSPAQPQPSRMAGRQGGDPPARSRRRTAGGQPIHMGASPPRGAATGHAEGGGYYAKVLLIFIWTYFGAVVLCILSCFILYPYGRLYLLGVSSQVGNGRSLSHCAASLGVTPARTHVPVFWYPHRHIFFQSHYRTGTQKRTRYL